MLKSWPGGWADAKATLAALQQSFAVIEFDTQGVILNANENFCHSMGYRSEEIVGRHHRIFVEPDYAESPDYRAFWNKLASGKFVTGECVRIGKNGEEVWLQASYSPVHDVSGNVYKIVKLASVITGSVMEAADSKGKLDALSRVQAMIEFLPDGTIMTANKNFLDTIAYDLPEIQGRHHSMFVGPEVAKSAEYAAFWDKLRAGEFVSSECKRIGKNGKEIWLQTSYNPIFDRKGRVIKVVKFATDITRRVHAINEIETGLKKLANNTLNYRLTTPIDPTYEGLRNDFNTAIQNLDRTIGAISSSVETVGKGADEISMASGDLARRTETQAGSLEGTASRLNQLTDAVTRSAHGAMDASTLASNVRTNAAKSGEVVNNAVTAMEQIRNTSESISQIVGMIDEIAFLTNMLSLNAAVEAARAGEAGVGFSVVASEVRQLAKRSADASKQIRDLISSSDVQVQQGVELVGTAGKALQSIVSEMSHMDNLMSDIATCAQEQAQGLAQINDSVSKLDHMTQKNAAMATQSTKAAHALDSQAKRLEKLTGHFKISSFHDTETRSFAPVLCDV
ncbi:methyl-accepting chemotaxis protein [Acetobacter sp. UBA5411]|uniref:methyl-accepting chemotaxis protein n=1 Tax=Acetobacter sp. UBA5411 TaxID=1945905 RepID=UPI0025BAD017|nr:methyl-accepting chemotaxis protein [Acetobacter sp. UBA5411]